MLAGARQTLAGKCVHAAPHACATLQALQHAQEAPCCLQNAQALALASMVPEPSVSNRSNASRISCFCSSVRPLGPAAFLSRRAVVTALRYVCAVRPVACKQRAGSAAAERQAAAEGGAAAAEAAGLLGPRAGWQRCPAECEASPSAGKGP